MLIQHGVLTSIDPHDIDANGHCIVPDGVRMICMCAFDVRRTLKSIQFPDGLEEVGMYAFENCTSLNYVQLPNGLKKVENWAFKNCTSLKFIRIPNSTHYISMVAFIGCPCFEDIICTHQDKFEDWEFSWLIENGHLSLRILDECKERLMSAWVEMNPKPHLLKKIQGGQR